MTKTYAFKTGDHATFHTVQSDLLPLDGEACKVVRTLTDDEHDYCETGPMYKIQIDLDELRCVLDVFEDELTKEA